MALTLSALLAPTALAGSVAGTGGSTEVTQILNNTQLLKENAELIEHTMVLKSQLDDMQRNSTGLTSFSWSSAADDLRRLAAMARQGQAMSYGAANQDAAYRNKYPGYSSYVREQTGSTQRFSDRYDDWSKTNVATITSAMQAAQLQESQFATEDQTMRQLEHLGETAMGRQQALQVGHQIAAQQVRQTQKLRALIMAQMQMQANYMAKESNNQDVQTAEGKKYFDKSQVHTQIGDEQSF